MHTTIWHPQDNTPKFHRPCRNYVVWPAASTCSVTIGAWQQCGGTSNCASGASCTDAQWYVNLKIMSICKTPFPVQSWHLGAPSTCDIHVCSTKVLAWLPGCLAASAGILDKAYKHTIAWLQAQSLSRYGCLPSFSLKHRVDDWQLQHLLERTHP